MKKVILKINQGTKIIEDIGEKYYEIPEGYEEHEIEYPVDVMCGYYRLIDGEIYKDEKLFAQYLKNITSGEQEMALEIDDAGIDTDGENGEEGVVENV